MGDSLKAAKVGALVVGALAATWLVYRFVDERAGTTGGYGVYAVFEDAQGLVAKSRVLIAGIQVGYIDDIRLEGSRARVDIRINDGVQLYDDASVAKRSASILGEAILVIHPGTPSRARVSDGDQIAAIEGAPGTDQILESVGKTAASVERVAAQLERTFGTDEGGDQMRGALKNLAEALEAVNLTIQQNQEAITRTVENVEEATEVAGPSLVRILENVEQATGDVRDILAENRGGLIEAGGDATEAVASINRAAHSLEDVLEDVEEVTDRTAKGKGTIGRLTSDEQLIDEVQGLAEDLGDIVGPISRLQTIVGLRSEFNFLANTFKNYVELQLKPREDRYYLIQLIDDPRGLTEFTRTTVRRSPPPDGEPGTFQETRVETRDAFLFSLEFAKRIYFATLRFGIIESTGGVGLDLHLLDDRLEVNADVFAFGAGTFPRLRTRLAYEVVSRLWILGGVDDSLNDSSDFFLGAQLRFNDEDLKAILPFAGGATPSGG